MEPPPGISSFWVDSTPATDYPALSGDITVDVAVLGAGITGLTTAALLKREGKSVAVVDLKRIGRGVTGYTTAKLTVGQNLIYKGLVGTFGEEGARLYAESNQAAIERVAAFVEQDGIDCDFERASNYVYTESREELDELREEVEAANRAGVQATLVTETDLPYEVAGAIRVDNQAQFHPRKFVLPLAAEVAGEGSHVFENTRALKVRHGDPCVVETPSGTIRARDVVVATHIPFSDRGLFFAKAHPSRSYAVAARMDGASAPRGMYISSSQPTRSIRSTPGAGGARVLVVGGEGHKPGQERDTRPRYEALERFLRERFQAEEVQWRWAAQDYVPVDGAPYIGRLTRRSRHIYVATGFAKWGLTKGVLAAIMFADAIGGRENPWAELYDAKRIKPVASTPKFVKENAQAGWHFVADRARRAGDVAAIAPGDGAVVTRGGRKLAVYRDEQGELHAMSAVCQHLYCIVEWNTAEKSWDCPCHGSRYSATGTVIQGPTVRDLKPADPPA